MKKKNGGEIIDNAYFELVRRFPLKPIASDRELDRAIQTVNELVDRGFENLTPGEEAYLDVLSDLVEKYENAHHSIPDASPVEMLKFFIEDRNTNQRAVALGSSIAISTMAEILAGRRRMNLEHMQKLATFFRIDVSVFLPKPKQPKTSSSKTHAAKKMNRSRMVESGDSCSRTLHVRRVRGLSNTLQKFLGGRMAGKDKMSLQPIEYIQSFDSRWGHSHE